MSRTLQVSVRESEVVSTAASRTLVAAPAPGRDNPLQLLREAITRLNSSNGEIPDQGQMADLLAEVREALERANVVARVATQCEEFIRDAQFDKAFQALDAGFLAYPADPALVARRSDLEDKQRAFQSAETGRRVLEEAQWLLLHNRLDLAATFLKEKTAEFPDQPTLISRLEEIEALLPQWEQDRQMQAALGRVAALEELQQCQMALTVIEEALQSYSASEELTDTAKRTRVRLANSERQNRLARRLELIGQKIAAQSWMPALALIENTGNEFPGTPELKALRREVDAGLKRSQCEAIVTEVRQCLTDGEPEQAEQALRRGMESLGQEPALAALREEVESERKYREELRAAQILFGRRQLLEAERVLTGIASEDRIEAKLLLDTVRQARAVTDEENFCERGREKALTLMQQQQFAQAADLLRNLCSLFPGNPILERDLQAAQGALEKGSSPEAAGAAAEENNELRTSAAPAQARLRVKIRTGRARTGAGDSGTDRVTPHSRVWRSAVAGTAALVLVSAGGAAWKFSQNGAPIAGTPGATKPIGTQPLVSPRLPASQPSASQPSASQPSASQPSASQPLASQVPAPQPQAQKPPPTTKAAPAREATQPLTQPPAQTQPPPARVLRSFVPPAAKQTPVQSPVVPLPPESAVTVSAEMVASLPADLIQPINISAPVPAAQVAAPSPKPPLPAGRNVEEPQLTDRWMPAYPDLARKRGIFGVVRLEATINDQGTVKHVKVVSGDPVLVAAATSAVMTWKYKAATLNGKAVPSIATIEVSFRDPAKK